MALVLPRQPVRVTVEDATVDQICFEFAWIVLGDRVKAGRLRKYVDATFDANPGLAAIGEVLPLGKTFVLPEFTVEADAETVRLWD
ncbi:phage tail protein X [Rhodobium orientis]|nr:tail protein X [Rhodobium orientis]MBB4302367.1 phage tail protein X [Rhodobium orientis]